jgi:hypothetical protein
MDDPLSIWERFQLNTHLLVCWVCRRFQKNIILLRGALRELAQESMAFEHYTEIGLPDLSPEARERILTAIRRQL